MDQAAQIVYLDLFRERRGSRMDQWAKLRETIADRSMPCPVTGCWLWFEGAAKKGYGIMQWEGRTWYVTRLSLLAFTGELPEGRFACHTCDVPSCVNPDHLYWGGRLDNARDSVSAGRAGRYPTADTAWGKEGLGEGSKWAPREVTAEYLRQILHYDHLSDIFRWHTRADVSFRINVKLAGKRAGTKAAIGYRSIGIGGKRYFEHRLAWLYMKRGDNRFENLRAATNQENGIARDERSRRATNKSGVTGVSLARRVGRYRRGDILGPVPSRRPEGSLRRSNKSGHLGVGWNKKSKKWHVAITVGGQRIFLGLFDRIEDAIAARREAEMKYRSAA